MTKREETLPLQFVQGQGDKRRGKRNETLRICLRTTPLDIEPIEITGLAKDNFSLINNLRMAMKALDIQQSLMLLF
ncbi:hypothetical protein THER_1904 [Thermodesulfovibrio sp. N1]|uniref:hypothetical protein n=1 Tax=Thermodesulfovibrio sp. N1 TaxID=1871110 RepID=UPI00083A6F7F|nr:hypothetical protein [Thermodesulfovibrio sp. N1]ODA43376.1 hypothetical protein THER_1904 [Thermodesulfovibrio sp. N1]